MVWVFSVALYAFSQAPVCPPSEPAGPAKWEQVLSQKLESFAQRPLIANEADRVLAQVSRNPDLQVADWLRAKGIEDSDPLRLAQKWRAYYLRHLLLPKFPTPNPQINVVVEELFKELKQSFLQPQWPTLKQSFHKAQARAQGRWQTESNSNLLDLLSQIKKVRLHEWDRLRGSDLQNQVVLFLERDFFWNSDQTELIIGLPFLNQLQNEQWEAHFVWALSFLASPCQAQALGAKSQSPFAKVLNCLSRLAPQLSSKSCSQTWPQTHLQVAFADWWTAEVTLYPQTLEGKSPLKTDGLCELIQQTAPGSDLPADLRRSFYFNHPQWAAKPQARAPTSCAWTAHKPG